MKIRPTRVLAMTLAATALVSAPAYAGSPDKFVDPNTEGSVTDVVNLRNTLLSDTTGLHLSVNSNGCVAAAERPQLQAAPSSPTGAMVKSQAYVTCQGLSTANDTFRLQRSRWSGWETLSSLPLTVQPQGVGTQAVVTGCRAGSWSYRVSVTGTHVFHTQAARFTCVNRTDLFSIDPN